MVKTRRCEVNVYSILTRENQCHYNSMTKTLASPPHESNPLYIHFETEGLRHSPPLLAWRIEDRKKIA